MSIPENEVLEAKRLRRTAREVFDTQKSLVQSDLDAAGLGKRVATRLSRDGKYMAEEAAETASKYPGVLGAGALALTAWFFRKPLLSYFLGTDDEEGTGEVAEAQGHEERPAPNEN